MDPCPKPEDERTGTYLVDVDYWADHAREHLDAALAMLTVLADLDDY